MKCSAQLERDVREIVEHGLRDVKQEISTQIKAILTNTKNDHLQNIENLIWGLSRKITEKIIRRMEVFEEEIEEEAQRRIRTEIGRFCDKVMSVLDS